MQIAIIIPARYASSRFPGKPLQILNGRDGAKTLIRRSWDRAQEIAQSDAGVSVYVATDDARIREEAESFGAEVIMTPESCRNGTERCAAALSSLGENIELVVNLQGDAPLTPSWFLSALIEKMNHIEGFDAATPVLRCDEATYRLFREDRAAGRVGGTTAVFAKDGRALYFSKEVIPYMDEGVMPDPIPVFHHVGVYAYRPDALRAYAEWQEGQLERLEGLEQLRFLENGSAMACVEVEAHGQFFWELNNPVDVARIEKVLA